MSGERAALLPAEAAPQAAAVPASRRAGGAAGRPRRAPRSPQPSCRQCWEEAAGLPPPAAGQDKPRSEGREEKKKK